MKLLFFIIIGFNLFSQSLIKIKNSSFEEVTTKNKLDEFNDWEDCGKLWFGINNPPNIHSNFDIKCNCRILMEAAEGDRFIGLVVREDSWEGISQRLEKPMLSNHCYSIKFSINNSHNYLCSNGKSEIDVSEKAVLYVWGGKEPCSPLEFLGTAETTYIEEWERKILSLKPKKDVSFLIIEAFYKNKPNPFKHIYESIKKRRQIFFMPSGNYGHILVDNISEINEIECDK